jgi:hypothetical protein
VYRSIDPQSVVSTVARLRDRVRERLPGSSLARVADELHDVALHSAERAEWARRPLLPVRVAMVLLSLLIVCGVPVALMSLRVSLEVQSAAELVQAIEASVNDLVFLGVGLYFLAGLEGRIKRARILAALHELRSISHIIDMHQLTKDPDRIVADDGGEARVDTPSSPVRNLSRFELGRYLDYCGEMLALLGKIAALYAQNTSDSVALSAVDQIEDLTSMLAQKIAQKILILHSDERRSR